MVRVRFTPSGEPAFANAGSLSVAWALKILSAQAMFLTQVSAAHWAVKAAARPNAHPHILAIAAYSLPLAGWLSEARAQATMIRRTLPRYSVADFFDAFRFDPDGMALSGSSAWRREGRGKPRID